MPDQQYSTLNQKKFLDAEGLTYFSRKLNNYPDNDVLQAVVDGIQDALEEKIDEDDRGAANGIATLDANGQLSSDQIPDALVQHIANTIIHLEAAEKQLLNTRVTAYRNANGTLVFSYGSPS